MLKISHIVNSVFTSRTYVLSDDSKSKCWLVDCGDIQPLIEILADWADDAPFEIAGVLLTHVHYDHIYGLPRLTEMFPSLRVFTNEVGKKALANERLNFSKYHEDPINYETDNVVICEDSDEIELFDGIKAVVHYTPGHNPACLTYEVGEYLFTGDSYIPGIKVVTNLPGGNKELAAQSLEKILELAKGKILCPGHVVEENVGND